MKKKMHIFGSFQQVCKFWNTTSRDKNKTLSEMIKGMKPNLHGKLAFNSAQEFRGSLLNLIPMA